MASAMSKRQLARNERALQDLIRSVPGNDQCADCQTRNPGWASWNLGIFLCMRCASLHRKLGTHISKVKSLSMDTWTTEQVESVKQTGNTAANKIYNPKNVKPDIPLDIDEVDSAMERFIRKKYQERSLVNGKPAVPASAVSSNAGIEISPENSPPPPLPPKKGKLFGFGLRAHSSAYPLSKHDKKNVPVEPPWETAFTTSSRDYQKKSRRSSSGARISEIELDSKLDALREMGFRDDRRNLTVLQGLNGDVERTVEALVRMGEHSQPPSRKSTPIGTESKKSSNVSFPEPAIRPVNPLALSNNPYGQSTNGAQITPGTGLQFPTSTPAAGGPLMTASSNQFEAFPPRAQTLEQSFQGMHISQPLFPNSTGGYPIQQPSNYDLRFQHSMTPPVPLMPQQYSYVASPATVNVNSNPFFQTVPPQEVSYNNPYAPTLQRAPTSKPQNSNPFFASSATGSPYAQQTQFPGTSQPTPSTSSSHNPFGIPPNSPPQLPQDQIPQFRPNQTQSPAAYTQQPFSNSADMSQSFNQMTQPQRSFSQPLMQQQSQAAFQSAFTSQQISFPSQASSQAPFSSLPQQPFYITQNQAAQPLAPQQTGRIDKSSILALYNYPHLAPKPPTMPSIPEPSEAPLSANPLSPTNPYAKPTTSPPRRSATMPVSASSLGMVGSRNPFLSNSTSGSGSPAPANGAPGIAARHVSQESVNILNLESGRHSPDAFASLSARYLR